MQVTQEQHDTFAAGLMLILPNPTWHKQQSTINIVDSIVKKAREGHYAQLPGNEQYAFYSPVYFAHLRPVILELWRAAYLAK